jgi:hypothetical protein
MGKAQQIERIISKGQLVPLLFSQGAVADAQSAVAMTVVDGVAKATEYTIPFEYDIIAVSITSDSARLTGTCTVDATIDGTATGLQAALNGTDTLRKHAVQGRGADGGAAGSRVGVKLTTAGSWTPITADVIVTVWCLVHLEGV